MKVNPEVFEKIVGAVGSQRKLAEKLKITPQSLTKWQERGIPPARVLDVERITNVSRHELRPDIFGPTALAVK